jgi:hypothetical protein
MGENLRKILGVHEGVTNCRTFQMTLGRLWCDGGSRHIIKWKNEKRDEITNRYQFCDWNFIFSSLPLIPIPLPEEKSIKLKNKNSKNWDEKYEIKIDWLNENGNDFITQLDGIIDSSFNYQLTLSYYEFLGHRKLQMPQILIFHNL